MTLTDDPTVYLEHFGVSVTAGAVSGLGILDAPGEYALGSEMVITDYALRCEAANFGSLRHGAAITVDSTSYTVKEPPLLLDDGVFCLLLLLKV